VRRISVRSKTLSIKINSMNAIIYLLQVSACTGIFYGFYYLMLRRLTFFSINRWYLLVTLILSFGIPLLTITIRPDAAPIVREVVYVNNMQTYQTGQVSQEVIQPPINWVDAIKAIYFLAVTALLIKLIVMLASFFRRVKRKSIIRIGNVHVVYNADKLNNGSFLNYIFLNDDELSPDEIQQIIAHEMLHVKLFHSVDRILAKLAQIVL
jgi:hypothetical protein